LPSGAVQVESWVVPPLVPWRACFAIFAGVGVVWCILFALWFRDRPEKKPSVNAAELALIRSSAAEAAPGHARVPWLKIIKCRNLWFLCIMYACQSYGWYFYITLLPRFMETQHGVSKTSALGAIYKGGPLWMGAIGCLLGGFLTDWFIRRTGNRKLGRRLFGIIGHSGCVLCFLACGFATTAFSFFVVISLAGFSSDITMASSWSLCQDIGRRHAAIVAGCMNMIGNLGGSLSSIVTGTLLTLAINSHASQLGLAVEEMSEAEKATGLMPGYQIAFLIFAAVHVISVTCWCMVDSTKPVVPEEESTKSEIRNPK
jgi:MFS transporter, ACS family, glucarate transporter